MFQLTKGEYEILTSSILRSQIVTANIEDDKGDYNLRSQIVTAKEFTMSRTLPYAFTEHGVAMLSSVLRSPLAIQVNIGIIRAFVEFRRLTKTLPISTTSEDIVQLRKDFPGFKPQKLIVHFRFRCGFIVRYPCRVVQPALYAYAVG